MPRNASDILERILHDHANTLDTATIEHAIAGFQRALTYPYYTPDRSGLHRRCRYCDVAITEVAREVCQTCEARHEPKEHLGEYGLPALHEHDDPEARSVRLDAVPHVTLEHGYRYADAWKEEPADAIAAAAIITWPEDDATQERFLAIDTEIETRLWPEVRDAMAAAFVKAANDILDRERQRDDA